MAELADAVGLGPIYYGFKSHLGYFIIMLNTQIFRNIFFNFALFGAKQPFGQGFFQTHYILVRRADHFIVNPHAIADTINRIFILLKGIRADAPEYSKWVFALNPKYAPIARWFGWSTNSGIYAIIDRTLGVISKCGIIYGVEGILACYTFINFIGVDLAFVLTSRSTGGRAGLLTKKSLLTIGFDGHEIGGYGINLPGTRGYRSALLYSRLFNMLLTK